MSDRLAVFNRGRIEQVGTPAEVYERPGDPVRRRLRRDVEPAERRGRARRSSGEPARSPSGRRRSTSPSRTPTPAADEHSATGRIRAGRLPGPGYALHRGARRRRRARRHPAEPGDVVDRGARPAGQGCPPGLEATAQSRPSLDAGPEASPAFRRKMRRRSMRKRRSPAALGGGGDGRRCLSSTGGGTPGAEPADIELGDGEGELNVLAWPGYVENGSTDPAVDWVTPFEDATGCTVTVQVFGTSDEAYTLFSTNPEQFDVIVGVGRREPAARAGGFVQPVNVDLVQELPGHLPGPQEQAVQHGRRRPLRRPARPRLEPADVADGPGHPGTDVVGADVRSRAPRRQGVASTTPRSTSPTPPSSS